LSKIEMTINFSYTIYKGMSIEKRNPALHLAKESDHVAIILP